RQYHLRTAPTSREECGLAEGPPGPCRLNHRLGYNPRYLETLVRFSPQEKTKYRGAVEQTSDDQRGVAYGVLKPAALNETFHAGGGEMNSSFSKQVPSRRRFLQMGVAGTVAGLVTSGLELAAPLPARAQSTL